MKALLQTIACCFFLFYFIVVSILAAQEDRDPFMGNYVLGNSAELYMMYSNPSVPSPWLFDFNSDISSITAKQLHSHKVYNQSYFDVCSGDFNGDGYDDAVEALVEAVTGNARLYLQVSGNWDPLEVGVVKSTNQYDPNVRLAAGNFDGDPENEFVLAYWDLNNKIQINLYEMDSIKTIRTLASNNWSLNSTLGDEALFDMSTGDFDADGYDEIVVIKNNAPIADEDSLYVAHIDLSIRTYDYNQDSGTLDSKTTKDIKRKHVFSWWDAPWPGYNRYHTHVRELMKLSIAAGNLVEDDRDEFVVGYSIWEDKLDRIWPESSWRLFRRLAPFMLSFKMHGQPGQFQIQDLLAKSSPNYWEKPLISPDYVNSIYEDNPDVWTEFPFTLVCEDLDMDGWDELLSSGSDSIDVFPVKGNLQTLMQGGPVWKTPGRIAIPINPVKWSWGIRRQFIVTDVNADTNDVTSGKANWHPELIIIDCKTPWKQQEWPNILNLQMRLRTFKVKLNSEGRLSGFSTGAQTTLTDMHALKNYTIAACDYDGDGLRLKKPKAVKIEGVIQPVVILNSPPVHFDIINENICDVNLSFNRPESPFYSEYSNQQVQSQTVITEFNRDWGISADLTYKRMAAGNGIRATLEGHYGDSFSKTDDYAKTMTIETTINADREDQIYYYKTNYNFLEYPVYYRNELLGNILVAMPDTAVEIKRTWVGNQNWNHSSFVPNHEIGNILSYNPPLENFNVANMDSSYFILPGQVTGNTGTFDGSIKFEDFSNSQTTTSKSFGLSADLLVKIGIEGELSVEPAGLGLAFEFEQGFEIGTNAYYEQKEIKTSTTSISNAWELAYHLAYVDGSIGLVEYEIIPYVYWSYNGALTLDYSAEPVGSWWNFQYGSLPDLSFILPWRYHTEMGYSFTPGEEYKRFETKDIHIFPLEPAPGDTVDILTKIHNYSLSGISPENNVSVRYYLGDPDESGEQITDFLEEGYARSPDYNIMEPRSETYYIARWILPADIAKDSRLYVVIDPDNTIEEIHENNNKGYVKLIMGKSTGIEEKITDTLPAEYRLFQNHPNPFNPTTNISYSIPHSGLVELKVYNILGQQVATLVNEFKKSGNYNVRFNPPDLSSGVYFYSLISGSYSVTKKMLIIR